MRRVASSVLSFLTGIGHFVTLSGILPYILMIIYGKREVKNYFKFLNTNLCMSFKCRSVAAKAPALPLPSLGRNPQFQSSSIFLIKQLPFLCSLNMRFEAIIRNIPSLGQSGFDLVLQ